MAFDVIWGPLSEQASRIGSVGSCSKSSTLSGVMSSVRPSAGQGAVEDDPDLSGGLLDRHQRVDPASADDVDDRERHPAGARETVVCASAAAAGLAECVDEAKLGSGYRAAVPCL